MQKVSCPSCGAEVEFRSAASVMAVCEYCHSTLLKDAESVKNIGKMAEVLEDYSPIQINTTGDFEGKHFSVVGRIQLRYEDGLWNEWYALFDDGSAGWLSDASGQYVFTVLRPAPPSAPAFQALAPGNSLTYGGGRFVASDVRTARCVAGQGELPFRVGSGWEAKVADFRSGGRFLTLDYSDAATPQLFVGESVDLQGLHCQLLRSEGDIAKTAGRVKGTTTALNCPNCGSAINYQAGMAFHVVCPACHAQVDCSTDKALVLQKHGELDRIITTLQLGDTGTIDGSEYRIIGFVKCREIESDESSQWVEYLLFDSKQGFLWLVESEDRWDRVKVLDEWPEQTSGDSVSFRGERYSKLYRYGAEVVYAAGAFNWRVAVGDKTRIIDYAKGDQKLTAEASPNEITWSLTRPVPGTQVKQWFAKGAAFPVEKPAQGVLSELRDANLTRDAIICSILLALINLPIAFSNADSDLDATLVALVVLWIPIWIGNRLRKAGRD